MLGILPNWDQSAHIPIDTHIFPPSLEDIYVVRDFPDELLGSFVNRELNKVTIKNKYPLLRVDDLFDQL